MRNLLFTLPALLVVLGCQSVIQEDDANLPPNVAAEQAYRKGEFADAAKGFSQALVVDPTNVRYRLGLANSQKELREYDSAEKNYTKILHRDPENLVARLERAHLYLQMKEYEKSLGDLSQVLSNPNYKALGAHDRVRALGLKGQILLARNDHPEAIDAFEQAVAEAKKYKAELREHYPALIASLARARFMVGAFRMARDDYEEYLALLKERGYVVKPDVYYMVVLLNYLSEEFEKARSYFGNLSDEQMRSLASINDDPSFFRRGGGKAKPRN